MFCMSRCRLIGLNSLMDKRPSFPPSCSSLPPSILAALHESGAYYFDDSKAGCDVTKVAARWHIRVDLTPHANGTVTVEHVFKRWGSYRPYKVDGTVLVLRRAVERHSAWLSQHALRGLPTTLLLQVEDWPQVVTDERGRFSDTSVGPPMRPPLPLYSRSMSSRVADIAVPDFTFAVYPEISSKASTGWDSVAQRLRAAGEDAVSEPTSPAARRRQQRRRRTLFWRGDISSGARAKFCELMSGAQPGFLAARDVIVNVSAVLWQGRDDNHQVSDKRPGKGFVPLEEQCSYGLLPHLEGRAYSAMLKYKLACGGNSVVLLQRQAYREWWLPALTDGVTHLSFGPSNGSSSYKWPETRIDGFWQVVSSALAMSRDARARMVAAGAAVAQDVLSASSVDCFWAAAIAQHAAIVARAQARCRNTTMAPLLTGSPPATETKAWTRTWWASVRDGSCGDTAPNDPGDCAGGDQGSWGLSDAGRVSWDAAVDECVALCGACARCEFMTISLAEGDCSWYRRCPASKMLKVAGFRSGRIRMRRAFSREN